jgi:hypothetical protein
MGWWLLVGDLLTLVAIDEQGPLTYVGDLLLLMGVSIWTSNMAGNKRITWDWCLLMLTMGYTPYIVQLRLQGDRGFLAVHGKWLAIGQPFIIVYVAMWHHFDEAMRMLRAANLVAIAEILEGLAA